jgi:hypothetical protein
MRHRRTAKAEAPPEEQDRDWADLEELAFLLPENGAAGRPSRGRAISETGPRAVPN